MPGQKNSAEFHRLSRGNQQDTNVRLEAQFASSIIHLPIVRSVMPVRERRKDYTAPTEDCQTCEDGFLGPLTYFSELAIAWAMAMLP